MKHLGLILVVLLLSACATAPKLSPEQALQERAQKYWHARTQRDMQTAYTMESAAPPRGDLSAYDFNQLTRKGAKILSVSVSKVSIDGDQGQVFADAKIMLPMRLTKAIETTFQESWVRIRGVWYHKTARAREAGQKEKTIRQRLEGMKLK